MAKLTEVFQKAAVRGGIQATDEAFTQFLATLPDVDVPDTIATGISSLMSEADAKVNPEVKKHFVRAALDTVDTKLADLAQELGLSAEQIEALKAEKNTYAKPDILKNALSEYLKANGKKADSPEAKKQIEELTAALQAEKQARAEDATRLTSEFENERVNNAVNAQFGNYQWSDAIPSAVRSTIVQDLLQKELAAAGAKIKRSATGDIELVNANDETLPFRLNNESVGFNQFADTLMAKHNLIKTTPAAGATPPATSTTTAAPATGQATPSPLQLKKMQENQDALAAYGIK